jgi:hypothetical protein
MQCRSPEVNRRLPRRFLLHADSVELLREVRRAQVTKIDDAGSEEIGLDTSDVSSQCRQVLDCACLLALSKAPPRPKAPEDRRSPRRWRAHYSRLRYQLDSLTAFSASPQAARALVVKSYFLSVSGVSCRPATGQKGKPESLR